MSSDGPYIVIGRDAWGDDVLLDIAFPSNIVCQGGTRTGKSVFAYCVLAGLATRTNVVVAGCDPSGLLLHPWHDAPRRSLRTIGSDMSAHDAALGRLTAELDHRLANLLADGRDKIDITDPETPIIFVVLEEYPGLLALAEAHDGAEGLRGRGSVTASIRRSVARLVQEGSKVGFKLLLLCQRADAAIVGGAERSNFATRISFRLDNGDAVRMLHPQATEDVVQRLLRSLRGVGYMDSPGIEPQFFRSDLLEYTAYMRVIHSAYPGAES